MDLATLDVRLAVTDSPVGDQPERVKCPNHDDQRPSASVYRDGLYCHVCRFHLGQIQTLAYLLYGSYDKQAMSRTGGVLEKYTAKSLDAYRERVTENTKTDPLPRTLASIYKITLYNGRSTRLDWLYARGLTDESIDRFNLGHDGTRFTIPVYAAEDHLLTFRFRRDDEYGTSYFDAKRGVEVDIPKYSGLRGRNGLYLYPEDWVAVELADRQEKGKSPLDYLVVVEGELDAVRLWQEGIPAVSTTNGAGNVYRVPQMLRDTFPQITRLFFATDQDEPGRGATRQGFLAASKLGFKSSWLEWDVAHGKDVTELYLSGHSLEDADVFGDETSLPLHRD